LRRWPLTEDSRGAKTNRLIEIVRQIVTMSGGTVRNITDFFERLSFQRGEIPAFSQPRCLLALNDLTVTGRQA